MPNLLPARLEGCFGGRCKLPLCKQSKIIETPGQVSLLCHAVYALFNHHLRSGGSCALQEVPTSVLLWGGTGVLPAADVVFPVVCRKKFSHSLRLLQHLTRFGLSGRSSTSMTPFFHEFAAARCLKAGVKRRACTSQDEEEEDGSHHPSTCRACTELEAFGGGCTKTQEQKEVCSSKGLTCERYGDRCPAPPTAPYDPFKAVMRQNGY